MLGVKNLNIGKKLVSLALTATLASYISSFSGDLVTLADEGDFVMQNDYVSTTANVNMRNDDSLYGDIILQIEKDEQLSRILSCENNWDLVIYKDKIGFVYGDYIRDLSGMNSNLKVSSMEGYIVANANVNLRLGPSKNDSIIGRISEYEIAEVLGKTPDGWYLVLYNGNIGYVSADYVKYVKTEEFSKNEDGKIFAYSTTSVNFRSEPTKDSKKLATLKKNSQVEILSQESNGWFKVSYNGQVGYISGNYLTFNPKDGYRSDFIKVVYAADEIDLKLNDDPNSLSLYTMSKNETCEVLREIGDYYFVRCAGKLGYIPKEKTTNLFNTFVVVDIGDQKLTLYRNNEILVETDIVTGEKYLYDTPTGMYNIRYKTMDTYLTGADYNVHVDYWMPFNGGIGLHDATWRSKFGGDIYERDGSHGCINIPHKYTDDIYYNVDAGTKVLVHK